MKGLVINQARMTSSRLPGKVLKCVLDKPLLQYQIERLLRARCVSNIVIATTTNKEDDPIVSLCDSLGISTYRGDEHNVLGRYFETAKFYQAETVVRITSDCPLIDPAIVDETIEYYLKNSDECDYVSNGLCRTYPIGMDVEVFSYKVLEDAFNKVSDVYDHEHVTSYIYSHPEIYKIANVAYKANVGYIRLTLDTKEDYELIKNIITELYPGNMEFNLKDILDLLNQHPEWIREKSI